MIFSSIFLFFNYNAFFLKSQEKNGDPISVHYFINEKVN